MRIHGPAITYQRWSRLGGGGHGEDGDAGRDAPLLHQVQEVPDVVAADGEHAQVEEAEQAQHRIRRQVRQQQHLRLRRPPNCLFSSVADPGSRLRCLFDPRSGAFLTLGPGSGAFLTLDPGPGAFLTLDPGYGIRNRFFRIPDPKPYF
jgi:hypothetical protein